MATVKVESPDSSNDDNKTVSPETPPQPPRSAFMCFTDAKKSEIRTAGGAPMPEQTLLKTVAADWNELSPRERAYWDEEARNDKVRFVREKAAYKGEIAVPRRRAKKHPLAPKRPMSAFLKYSKTRRPKVKSENPNMSNTDVSRLLGEMWRNASTEEKAPYIETELQERAVYKAQKREFDEDQAQRAADSRTSHREVQQQRMDYLLPVHAPRHPFDEHVDSNNFDPFRVQPIDDAIVKADERLFSRSFDAGFFGEPTMALPPAPQPAEQRVFRTLSTDDMPPRFDQRPMIRSYDAMPVFPANYRSRDGMRNHLPREQRMFRPYNVTPHPNVPYPYYQVPAKRSATEGRSRSASQNATSNRHRDNELGAHDQPSRYFTDGSGQSFGFHNRK